MLDFCLSHLLTLVLVVLVAATLFVAARTLPAQNVFAAAFLVAVISGLIEAVGASTGIPFGPHIYTGNLGHMLFWVAPWQVPLIWVVVIFNSRGTARLILRPWRGLPHYGYWSNGVTCLLAVFVDLALEPFAHANRYWLWQISKTGPAWYGAPWVNFAAWIAVTLLILGFVLPWLINKKSGTSAPPDYPPLILWLLVILLLTAGNATHSYWLAVAVSLAGGGAVTCVAVRNSRR